jgi:preprotein translocase subunit SecG
MIVKNRLEKFLIALSSFFFGIILILGIKIEDTNKKLEKINKDLDIGPSADVLASNQTAINQTREKIIDTVTKAPAQDITANTTTRTVIPGKVVPVQVTKTSGGSSSSSSKTTKTS